MTDHGVYDFFNSLDCVNDAYHGCDALRVPVGATFRVARHVSLGSGLGRVSRRCGCSDS